MNIDRTAHANKIRRDAIRIILNLYLNTFEAERMGVIGLNPKLDAAEFEAKRFMLKFLAEFGVLTCEHLCPLVTPVLGHKNLGSLIRAVCRNDIHLEAVILETYRLWPDAETLAGEFVN